MSARATRTALVRGMAALMAVVTGLTLKPAHSAPADIFSMPAPVLGAEVPKASSIKTGDASVATQTGAMTYSYPVAVPPGRNGMAPKLSLNYSSQAAIYGGIAAGWSLDVPMISEDHSYGRLRTRSPEVDNQLQTQGLDTRSDDKFVSSLAGGRPLVLTGEAVDTGVYGIYRAQNDTSYARYERMNVGQVGYHWRVRSTDGTVMRFGETARTQGCTSVSEQYAPLTTMTDPFGNEVQFSYGLGLQAGECRLNNITWGYNASAGITQPFARVVFGWGESQTCASGVATGSFRDYRTGNLVVRGASKLFTITSTAFPIGQPTSPEHTRVITLDYDALTEECNRHHAPYRSLTSIQESAWIGSNIQRVDLPAVRFTYGGVPMITTQADPQSTPWNGDYQRFTTGGVDGRNALSWGYRRASGDRWPTVEAMTIDLDGDGLIDRLFNAHSDPDATITDCKANWQRNNGPDASGNVSFTTMPGTIPLPRLKWRGTAPMSGGAAGGASALRDSQNYEYCALNGQVTTFQNSDGLPGCHMPNSTCAVGTNGTGKAYCSVGGTECHPGAGQSGGYYRTYLAYRWIDMDNDALPELVTAVHGNTSVYDIERGNLAAAGYNLGEPSMSGMPAMGTWPACPGQMDRCKEVGRSLDGARTCSGGLCTWNWATVNSVLSGSASADCFDLLARPAGTGTAGATPHRAPYTRCQGLYPWFIYWNRGNGTFATTPTVKYQPIPLESEVGDSSLNGPTVISTNHAVHDVDGDGIMDGLVHPKSGSTATPHGWYVWLGDGTGGFLPRRYYFPTRGNAGDANAFAGYTGLGGTFSENARGLVDVNGDGLADQWVAIPNAVPANVNANITLSDGTQQRSFSTSPLLAGEIDTPASVRPGHDVLHSGNASGLTGTATAKLRTIDLDEDGRVDVVKVDAAPVVYWNSGGQFASTSSPYPHTVAGATDGLRRNTTALNTGESYETREPYWWRVESDLFDIDGNGILDNLYYEAGVLKRKRENTSGPPRVMTTINNGRGATTTIAYASMHDNHSATPTVTQAPHAFAVDQWCPETPSSLGCPKASPRAMWVVKSVTSGDAFASMSPSGTTSYRYWYPRWAPDDAGRYGFRGFEEVETTAQSGARTVQRYGFGVDWSGRLTATLVYADSTDTSLRTLDKTTWNGYSLSAIAGAVKTYHPTRSERFVCANGNTEAACTTAGMSPGYVRTTTIWVGAPVNATATDDLMMVASNTWIQPTATLASTLEDGDRQTATTYQLDVSPTKYLVRPYETIKQHRVAGAWVTFGKHRSTWNTTTGQKLTDETWSHLGLTGDDDRSIARYEYWPATGNLRYRWKPKQNAAGTTKTSLVYDAKQLFVATTTNEAGHVVDAKYDYGTGATIETNGPNERTCQTNCPAVGASHPLKQQTKVVVDGLGRTKERWATWSEDGAVYELFKLEQLTYVDTPSGSIPTSIPTSVTSRSLVEYPSLWREQRTDIDGHGRPKQTTVYVQTPGVADHVTSYVYRNDGTLQTVSVPNPSGGSPAFVTYTYTFDTLGRPLSVRRPDAIVSGVDMTYDGTSTTTLEVASDTTVPAATKSETDKLGRLSKISELTAPNTWAVTTYAYGPDDSVTSITDPAGGVTSLAHDFAGRRTRVTRGTRHWVYEYDKNGNVKSEQVPSPNPTLDGAQFRTSLVYDDLDRVIEKQLAPRGMNTGDLDLFAAGRELFTYDQGYKGQPNYWQALRPGATSGNGSVVAGLYFDGSGRRTITNQSAQIAGLPALSRGYLDTYNPNGTLFQTRYRDVFPPEETNETIAQFRYDARGLPSKIDLVTPTPLSIGVQTRNTAGLVTERLTNQAGAMASIRSKWSYDVLGRVTDQHIERNVASTTSTVARQQLITYFGNDDVKSLTHQMLGATTRTFNYQYDRRHQLTNAADSASSYFVGAYTYGATPNVNAGRLTRATHTRTINPATADPKLVRNVNYVYGGVDPEQVTALTNVSGGTTFASYTYDLAGNQTTRTYPSTTPSLTELWEYVYDGKDQLRRATKKVGGVVQGIEEYWYGEAGQRMLVLKRNGGGTKTGLTWFIGDTEAHYSGTGALTKIYSHLSLGTPIARMARTSNTATTLEYQFHGLASHTIAAVAQSGTINATFSYTPFGEVLEATNGGGTSAGIGVHKRRSNDKIEDDLTRLAYYGARYYDKTLIGWTQADPLYLRVPDKAQMSTPRRANIYAFSLNNSLRYIDPDGLDPKSVPAPSGFGLDSFFADQPGEATYEAGGWDRFGTSGETSTTALRTIFGMMGLTKRNQEKRATRTVSVPSPVFAPWGEDLGCPDGDSPPAALAKVPGKIPFIVAVPHLVAAGVLMWFAGGSLVATVTPAASAGTLGTGAGAVAAIAPRVQVTAEMIQRSLANSTLMSQQNSVSLPVVQNYVDRLAAGSLAPAIRMSGSTIVDGVHRYVAGSVFGQLPTIQQWTAPMRANLYPVCKLAVDTADWGNR